MTIISAKEIGVPVSSPVTNMAAAAVANAVTAYTLPVLAGVLVGTKSAKITKVILNDNGTGGTKVHIGTGTGAGFVALLPALDCLNGVDNIYNEVDLPPVEAFSDITAYPDAVGGSSIDIQLEVLVRG